jgi:hypothetical protein
MPGTIDFAGFDFDDVCYGTVANGNDYFSKRPQSLEDWLQNASLQRLRGAYFRFTADAF